MIELDTNSDGKLPETFPGGKFPESYRKLSSLTLVPITEKLSDNFSENVLKFSSSDFCSDNKK